MEIFRNRGIALIVEHKCVLVPRHRRKLPVFLHRSVSDDQRVKRHTGEQAHLRLHRGFGNNHGVGCEAGRIVRQIIPQALTSPQTDNRILRFLGKWGRSEVKGCRNIQAAAKDHIRKIFVCLIQAQVDRVTDTQSIGRRQCFVDETYPRTGCNLLIREIAPGYNAGSLLRKIRNTHQRFHAQNHKRVMIDAAPLQRLPPQSIFLISKEFLRRPVQFRNHRHLVPIPKFLSGDRLGRSILQNNGFLVILLRPDIVSFLILYQLIALFERPDGHGHGVHPFVLRFVEHQPLVIDRICIAMGAVLLPQLELLPLKHFQVAEVESLDCHIFLVRNLAAQ